MSRATRPQGSSNERSDEQLTGETRVLSNRLNRLDKSKPCDKCEQLEKAIDAEKRLNAQLKRLIEDKQRQNKAQALATTCTAVPMPCEKCGQLKEQLDIEKNSCAELSEQLIVAKKRTDGERADKEVCTTTSRDRRHSSA
jgi:hypothetical protein